MMKWLNRIFVATVYLIISISFSLLFLLSTETGTGYTLKFLSYLTDNHLTIENVNGTLMGELTIGSMHFENEKLILDIDDLKLRWTPLAILRLELSIDELEAKEITIFDKVEKKETIILDKLAWPIPFYLTIDDLQIDQLNLTPNPKAEKIQINQIKAANTIIDKKQMQLALHADLHEPFDAKINLNISGRK